MTPSVDSAPLRVLYIGGWGRSGSTLLDRMLGELPGVVSAGELRELWKRGLVENQPCGCGEHFRSCRFWTQVGTEAFGGWDELPLEEVLRHRYALDRAWSIPLLLAGRPRGAALGAYVDVLTRLYRGVAAVSGASVIVDSSKLPSHAFLLRHVPGIDLRVVHLVRDSRAVAFSWQRDVVRWADGERSEYMHKYRPGRASARWLAYNWVTHLSRFLGLPYLRVRYEDLVAEPHETLRRIAAHAGVADGADLGFVGDETVRVGRGHTVDGNPMRFAQGSLRLRVDDEWRSAMRGLDRALVTASTLPLLWRYGYGPGWAASR